jgi:hypothetical protein
VTVVLSLLFWDLGWRTGAALVKFTAILYAVVGVLEVLHVLAALEPSSASATCNETCGACAPAPGRRRPIYCRSAWACCCGPSARRARPWPVRHRHRRVAVGLFALFQWLPRYTRRAVARHRRDPRCCRSAAVDTGAASRSGDAATSIASAMRWRSTRWVSAWSHCFMLYSDQATSKFAMTAHFGVFGTGLNLLLGLMQMGTADTARRMRDRAELKVSNEELERAWPRAPRSSSGSTRICGARSACATKPRCARCCSSSASICCAGSRTPSRERQDLAASSRWWCAASRRHLPADFVAICDYDRRRRHAHRQADRHAQPGTALDLAMSERARIPIDQNGLSRCVGGQQVYEPDISASTFPFPQRLAHAGLRSMVIVPLMVERDAVFAVLVVARRAAHAFSSGECEFLRQLCDQVALAANQAQLHDSLQQAYENLKLTQQAVLEQERLRALGQMASGIAHDINNAISPVAVYVESLLTYESGFSDRARKQLQIIQRAVDDVARTVARMGEFYRRKPAAQELAPVRVERVLREVLDLTRARWSDMASSAAW